MDVYGMEWKNYDDRTLLAFNNEAEQQKWLNTEGGNFNTREILTEKEAESLFGENYEEIAYRWKCQSKIQAWREYRNLTQGELGERIGKSRQYICDLENGWRDPAGIAAGTLLKIARALRATMEDLL